MPAGRAAGDGYVKSLSAGYWEMAHGRRPLCVIKYLP